MSKSVASLQADHLAYRAERSTSSIIHHGRDSHGSSSVSHQTTEVVVSSPRAVDRGIRAHTHRSLDALLVFVSFFAGLSSKSTADNANTKSFKFKPVEQSRVRRADNYRKRQTYMTQSRLGLGRIVERQALVNAFALAHFSSASLAGKVPKAMVFPAH